MGSEFRAGHSGAGARRSYGRFDTSWSYQADGAGGDRSDVQARTDTIGVNGAVNNGSSTSHGYGVFLPIRVSRKNPLVA